MVVVYLKNGIKADVQGADSAEWETVNLPHGTPTMLVCKAGAKVVAQFVAEDVAGWVIEKTPA